jgi:probable rRNA maturation factor
MVDIDTSEFIVNTEAMELFAFEVCKALGIPDYELCIRIVDLDEIHQLNRSFRGIDKPTDVLSFPQQDWKVPLAFTGSNPAAKLGGLRSGPPQVLGDIALCLDIAKTNSASIAQPLAEEACFLIVHGILHLCGHDHIEPEEELIMIAQQKSLMSYLSHQDSWPVWSKCVKIGESLDV